MYLLSLFSINLQLYEHKICPSSCMCMGESEYSKNCVKWPLSKDKKTGFQDRLSLNAGQKILSTFIKLPVVKKTFVLSIFEWPFYTGFILVLQSS